MFNVHVIHVQHVHMFQHGHVFSCSCLSMFMFMFHGSNMLHHVHACCDIECSMPGCHWPHMTNLCFALPGTKTCLSGWKLPCICWRKKMFDSSLEALGDRTGQKGLSLGFSCFGRFLIRKCPSRTADPFERSSKIFQPFLHHTNF